MPGAAFTTLAELAAEQHGYVTPADARAVGVGGGTVARMAERGTLYRISQGVYRVPLIPRGPWDEYMEAVLWPRGVRGVLSHETALDLYDLSDVSPAKIHLTLPRGHRVQREIPTLYELHHADLRDNEITAIEGIRIVTPERAVLDAYTAGLGPALIGQAIKDGRRKGIFSTAQAEALRERTARPHADRW